MSLETEVTEIIEIENLIGQVQVSPTSNTILDRLKQIQANTLAGEMGNFTSLNSANTDLSKADLDSINTQQIASLIIVNDILASIGLPVLSPVQYTILDRLKSIDNDIQNSNNPFFESNNSITRPNNSTAYAAYQAFSASTSSPTVSNILLKPNSMIQIDEILLVDTNTNIPAITPAIYLTEIPTVVNFTDGIVPSLQSNLPSTEIIEGGGMTRIPGNSTNYNVLKFAIINLNIKMKTDANGYIYYGIVPISAFVPIPNEILTIIIKGRYL